MFGHNRVGFRGISLIISSPIYRLRRHQRRGNAGLEVEDLGRLSLTRYVISKYGFGSLLYIWRTVYTTFAIFFCGSTPHAGRGRYPGEEPPGVLSPWSFSASPASLSALLFATNEQAGNKAILTAAQASSTPSCQPISFHPDIPNSPPKFHPTSDLTSKMIPLDTSTRLCNGQA